MAMGSFEGFIDFERMVNFRDIGGYETADGRRTKWRRLFRSGAPDHISQRDFERAQALGIRTLIDLRQPTEFSPDLGPPVAPPTRRHSLPYVTREEILQIRERFGGKITPERYLAWLEYGGKSISQALQVLAVEEAYPAAIHCTFGKDRTGVLVALLLDFLGVNSETIIDDYAISDSTTEDFLSLQAQIFEERKQRGELQVDEKPPEFPPSILGTPPERMRGFLQGLHSTYGSARTYCETLDLDPAIIHRLEALLLENNGDNR